MLIAEDLVLLVTDDETGKKASTGTGLDAALGGAILMELALRGRVEVEGEGRKAKVVVRDGGPTGEPLLDDAVARLSSGEPLAPRSAVALLGKKAQERLHDSLVGRGILRREEGRVLGIFPVTRWPAADSAHESALRTQLHDVLVVGVDPTPEVAATISLLHAADLLGTVVDRADRKVAKQRAKEIESVAWASAGVRQVVEAANAAVLVAVMAATTATAASSGSG
ncbi:MULTISPECIES: GOLPH3/VPS74 family protein [Mumia]|uniref:GOLPH3/VPS74 family protein n=1 Tax=Mumia TaxID=1546255 RepID=UPI00141E89B8|nr:MULTISPECIES: GPP34 family phosphoprotein [unclassified Mumia]QMW66636.1 GPP34 family phosphoprotein [Mumia sp. ZJ1417]